MEAEAVNMHAILYKLYRNLSNFDEVEHLCNDLCRNKKAVFRPRQRLSIISGTT